MKQGVEVVAHLPCPELSNQGETSYVGAITSYGWGITSFGGAVTELSGL